MNGKPNETAYQLAARTAAVAGMLVLIVCALLLYDYARRLAKDPLDSATFTALIAALEQQPTNEALKIQIRDLDLQLRREYYRQKAFTGVGAGLLLAAVAVFLAAAKIAATLRRRLPSPTALPSSEDREAAWTQVARWAVGALCVVMVGGAIGLSLGVRSPLQQERERLAIRQSGNDGLVAAASSSSSAGDTVGQVNRDTPQSPPSDEDTQKMWPRFRGPDGQGISAYTNVPDAWDGKSGKGILWKTPVPLPGNNSPVVWGNRVFLSGADERRREVYCFDVDDGKLLWRQAAPGTPPSTARPPTVNEDTGYAASTMATDGRRAYAIFANGDLAAFDFNGTLAWSKSLGVPENSYGHASSLAMHKNLLVVQLDQGAANAGKSKLMAFDSASGKVVWQVVRPVSNSWTSPIVVRFADSDQVITAADPWVIAYHAVDGKEIWRAKSLRTDIGPSPAFADGKVFVAGESSPLSAIRADGKGDVTATGVVWKGDEGIPDTCSPLATKEFVFVLASLGTLTCYDATKGDVLWSEDFSEDFTASPSLAGNRVYLIGKSGKAWIVEPSRAACKRLGEADLGEECVTSPAFQEGRIYLRGKNQLYCIGR